MATRKSSRKPKVSQRPLDDDFLIWKDLSCEKVWSEYSLSTSANFGKAPSEMKQDERNLPNNQRTTSEQSANKQRTTSEQPTNIQRTNSEQTAASDNELVDYRNLKLLKETHELEITKLKLQLQLAMLGNKTCLAHKTSRQNHKATSAPLKGRCTLNNGHTSTGGVHCLLRNHC